MWVAVSLCNVEARWVFLVLLLLFDPPCHDTKPPWKAKPCTLSLRSRGCALGVPGAAAAV